MIKPTLNDYIQLQADYSTIPIYTQFKEDYFTPIAIFEKLKDFNPIISKATLAKRYERH